MPAPLPATGQARVMRRIYARRKLGAPLGFARNPGVRWPPPPCGPPPSREAVRRSATHDDVATCTASRACWKRLRRRAHPPADAPRGRLQFSPRSATTASIRPGHRARRKADEPFVRPWRRSCAGAGGRWRDARARPIGPDPCGSMQWRFQHAANSPSGTAGMRWQTWWAAKNPARLRWLAAGRAALTRRDRAGRRAPLDPASGNC